MTFFTGVLALVALYALAGAGSAFVERHLGLLSISNAAVLGTGAYAYAIAAPQDHLGSVLALGWATFLCALVGIGVVGISRRVRSDAFALATFALQLMWFAGATNAEGLTGGVLGVTNIPGIDFSFLNEASLAAALGLSALLVFWVGYRGSRASFFHVGSAIVAKSDELAATLGLSSGVIRAQIGAMHGAALGLAGALLASLLSFIDPTLFDTSVSILILAIGLFARLTFWGVAMGSVFLVGVPQLLRLVGLSATQAGAMQLVLGGSVVLLAGFFVFGSERSDGT